MDLKEKLLNYNCFNEQEEKDKELFLYALESFDNVFTRSNTICHFTASSWLVNKKLDKVLMCFHKIFNSYSWLGGHADGEKDLKKVCLKEITEESGLKNIKLLNDDIFSIESLTVDGHIKNNEYVSSHLHLNITYLVQADENEKLTIKEDENTSLKWFTLKDALNASSEPWFVKNIYSKLNTKLELFFK